MPRLKKTENGAVPALTKGEIESRWKQIDARMTRMVGRLLSERNMSQSAFSRSIGFTQANVSNVLSPLQPNHWSIPLLIATAHFFGTSIGELLSLAETADTEDNDTLRLFLARCGTAPGSPERLAKLIRSAIGGCKEANDLLVGNNGEAVLGCRVSDFEFGAPEFYSDYTRGELGDPDVLTLLSAAVRSVHNRNALGKVPLWAAVRDEFQSNTQK